ncbi:hypothetical protein [Shewanella sp. GXUN23E]
MSHSERFDKWDDEPKKSRVKKVKPRRRDNKRRMVDEEANFGAPADKWS